MFLLGEPGSGKTMPACSPQFCSDLDPDTALVTTSLDFRRRPRPDGHGSSRVLRSRHPTTGDDGCAHRWWLEPHAHRWPTVGFRSWMRLPSLRLRSTPENP